MGASRPVDCAAVKACQVQLPSLEIDVCRHDQLPRNPRLMLDALPLDKAVMVSAFWANK